MHRVKQTQFSILDLLYVTTLAAITFACFRVDLGSWPANMLARCLGTAAMIAAWLIVFRRFGFR
jgi:hypothetical protein